MVLEVRCDRGKFSLHGPFIKKSTVYDKKIIYIYMTQQKWDVQILTGVNVYLTCDKGSKKLPWFAAVMYISIYTYRKFWWTGKRVNDCMYCNTSIN